MMDGPAASILNGIFKSVIHLKNKEKEYLSSKKSTINLSKFEGRYSKRWGDSQIINVRDYLVSFWLDNTNPFEYIYKLDEDGNITDGRRLVLGLIDSSNNTPWNERDLGKYKRLRI